MAASFLSSVQQQFNYYKSLGEKALAQVPDDRLFWQTSPESNSMATIVKHLWGNMRSRWTDFLHSDGEKTWRQREAEFDNDIGSRTEMMDKWNEGWQTLFEALDTVSESDLERIVYIRNQGHTVTEAIHRQLAHYAYHVGQIVFMARMSAGADWQSLSIPRGASAQYNAQKFATQKQRQHFTKEFLDEQPEK